MGEYGGLNPSFNFVMNCGQYFKRFTVFFFIKVVDRQLYLWYYNKCKGGKADETDS